MTIDFRQDFGVLRSLSHAPSINSWRRICGMVDRWMQRASEPRVDEQMVPYLMGQFRRWPTDLLRFAPHMWLHDAMGGASRPQLQFATAMHFVSQETSLDRLIELFSQPSTAHMRVVDLRALRVQEEVATYLMWSPCATSLERVRMRPSDWSSLPYDLRASMRHLHASSVDKAS